MRRRTRLNVWMVVTAVLYHPTVTAPGGHILSTRAS